jgi:long-chain acyl-CoA synthetase
MSLQIHTAPAGPGHVMLGRTLPQLLDEAVENYPNPSAFNQPREQGGWTTLSNQEFKDAADEIALGLLEIGLGKGDKVAFFMNSDVHFSMADFGSLIAGLVNVPLYTTYSRENLTYVTGHAEAKAMFVSNTAMLEEFAGWIGETPGVRKVIVAEGEGRGVKLPEGVRLLTLAELRGEGRTRRERDPDEPKRLRDGADPQDLVTLIYTSGTTGLPKGVMLTHENISSNVYGAFTGIAILGHQEEVALTFLPLTHIFARMLSFAHVAWGHSVYYSDPEHLVQHLPEVRPTVFATVPRVLEKVFDKVLLGLEEASGMKKKIGTWAIGLAQEYEIGEEPKGVRSLQYALADKLVYSKLREKLGLTRLKAVAVGGAALRADLANAFFAMGIHTYQGYGLTETSPVITVATPARNRAGTVGPPIPGVEVAIAEDGEILTRGPHVMKGYYKDEEQTGEVMDEDGWFHTGDIGEFTTEGYLKITDRKKSLFKLSTGKYVIPQPIENALMESPLVDQAVVTGSGHKYTAALLFPNVEAVQAWARPQGIDPDQATEQLLRDPKVVAEYERLVMEANRGMDPWSQVKRFRLIPEPMTPENGLLTPTMKVKRRAVQDRYGDLIEAIYAAQLPDRNEPVAVTA